MFACDAHLADDQNRGLGRSQPQIAPPASDAGRGMAKRRRDRRAEVRRLPPRPAHSTNAALHSNKTHRTSNQATTKANRFQAIIGCTPCLGVGVPLQPGLCRSSHCARGGFPPTPDEPRVVGGGRDRRSRRRSGRERSAPAPNSRGRSGPIRPSKEEGRAGAQQRGVRRDLVPGAGPRPRSGHDCLP